MLRQSAAERERQLRAIMHEEVSTQVVRQVAEETGKTLRKDEYAARRTALADAFIEKTGKMVTARPSDILTLAAGKKLAVTATGAEPLTEAQTEKLRRTLTDVFAAACRAAGEDAPCGEIIDLYSETDESVIAGMRLRVGDTVYDGSAARCLERLVHRASRAAMRAAGLYWTVCAACCPQPAGLWIFIRWVRLSAYPTVSAVCPAWPM